jgi:hypothetical protein
MRKKEARSEWGRKLARARWDKREAELHAKIKSGEIPPPPPEWPRDRPYYTISLIHHPTGREHVFDLYPSREGRRDQYCIFQGGKPWKAAMGLTRFLRGLGAAMFGENAERRAGQD